MPVPVLARKGGRSFLANSNRSSPTSTQVDQELNLLLIVLFFSFLPLPPHLGAKVSPSPFLFSPCLLPGKLGSAATTPFSSLPDFLQDLMIQVASFATFLPKKSSSLLTPYNKVEQTGGLVGDLLLLPSSSHMVDQVTKY